MTPQSQKPSPHAVVGAPEAQASALDGNTEPAIPSFSLTGRKLAFIGVFFLISLVGLYYLMPQLIGFNKTWQKIESGSPGWLIVAFVCAIGSFVGYVALFQFVFVTKQTKITWKESYQITMAGLAATRIFAAGGAGGIVLTAWALRRSGMRPREVADKTLAFLVLTYFVYMAALIICGFGLYFGLFPGHAPFPATCLPAVIATAIIGVAFLMTLVPRDFERRLEGFAQRQGRIGRLAQKLAHAPASVSSGVRDAMRLVKTGNPALFGAVAFWAFQIAVLWAAFRAFGEPPPLPILITGFFLGMIGNLLPMPGGVGGVDGGLIGAFLVFGHPYDLVVLAVLTHRAFVFWLPTLPGAIAYFQLRRTVERWKHDPARVRAAAS